MRKGIELIKTIMVKYTTELLSGPMYERYMKAKKNKRERWDKMRKRILSRNKGEML